MAGPFSAGLLALLAVAGSPGACLTLVAPPMGKVEGHAALAPVSDALRSQAQALLNSILKAGSEKAHRCKIAIASQRPVPKPETATYSPRTCRNFFPFKDDRDLCIKLQKAICNTKCGCLLPHENTNATTLCTEFKQKLCVVPVHAPSSNATVVEGGSDSTTTFCNAYISNTAISIQHDKYYALPDPAPFVQDLKYLDCVQAKIPSGDKVNIYLGSYPMTKHVVGSEGAIVLLGQYNLGESEMGVSVKTFKDEGYKRPIVCSAYPSPQLGVGVAGRKWHPFSDAEHPKSLAYMECEKLALDHADSVFQPETLEFFDGEAHKGDVEISPVQTLYIIGAPEPPEQEVMFKAYSYDHLIKPKSAKAKAEY